MRLCAGAFAKWPAKCDISRGMAAQNVASCGLFPQTARKVRHFKENVGWKCRVLRAIFSNRPQSATFWRRGLRVAQHRPRVACAVRIVATPCYGDAARRRWRPARGAQAHGQGLSTLLVGFQSSYATRRDRPFANVGCPAHFAYILSSKSISAGVDTDYLCVRINEGVAS